MTSQEQLDLIVKLRDMGVARAVMTCKDMNGKMDCVFVTEVEFSQAKQIAAAVDNTATKILDDPDITEEERQKRLARRRDELLYGRSLTEE